MRNLSPLDEVRAHRARAPRDPVAVWTLDTDAGSRLYDPASGTWTVPLAQALGLAVASQ